MSVSIIENTKQARKDHGYAWGCGNLELSTEHIKALESGKCIAYFDGEYVTFITYANGAAINGREEQTMYFNWNEYIENMKICDAEKQTKCIDPIEHSLGCLDCPVYYNELYEAQPIDERKD